MCLLLYSRRVQQQKKFGETCRGVIERENGNKRRTWLEQFVHWAVDRLGTGQEINRISTCIKYVSNVF